MIYKIKEWLFNWITGMDMKSTVVWQLDSKGTGKWQTATMSVQYKFNRQNEDLKVGELKINKETYNLSNDKD